MKASVNIFQNKIKYSEDVSSPPEVPDDVFEAAKEALSSKQIKIVKFDQGFFLIEPSQTGPFSEEFFSEQKAWLPVKIYRFQKWQSGGIRQEEFKKYLERNVKT